MTKIAGSESESISQRHGSADPDPHQNVMDPLHCLEEVKKFFSATVLKCMYFERHQTCERTLIAVWTLFCAASAIVSWGGEILRSANRKERLRKKVRWWAVY